MKKLLLLTVCATLLCVGWSRIAVAGVYRWVDNTGQVHYSDTPHPAAEEITIRAPNVSRGYSRRESQQDTTGDPESESGTTAYKQVLVTSPAADESLWNIGGRLNAKISVQPRLEKGHGLVVFLDGKRVNQEPQMNTSFSIENVFRGTHTIRAAVYTQAGQVLLNGPSVTFYVKQNSVAGGL